MGDWRRTGETIPEFGFELLDGGSWHSRADVEGRFRLLSIYRGKWCGHCEKHLRELDRLIPEFTQRGVSVTAVSADTRERANEFADKLELRNLQVGFEIPMESARSLGVFISAKAKEVEMARFCEPAHFLIGGDLKVFAAWISSCAFARTPPGGILDYIDFIGDDLNRRPRGSA